MKGTHLAIAIAVLLAAFVLALGMAASDSDKARYPDVVDPDGPTEPQTPDDPGEGGNPRPATAGERNALDKARDLYKSVITYYSEKGMRDALTGFYGFTEAEADYALSHLDADWQSQADKQARRYQEGQHIGPDGVADMLTQWHDFTEAQALQAVKDLGDVDWGAEAVKRAEVMRDERQYSRAWAEDALKDEGYSQAQVAEALRQVYG